MNNALILDDLEEVQSETRLQHLHSEEEKLIKIIEALRRVSKNKDWIELDRLLFSGIATDLERQLRNESLKKPLNEGNIYILQGQLVWARKYGNLLDLAKFFKVQLEGLRKQING